MKHKWLTLTSTLWLHLTSVLEGDRAICSPMLEDYLCWLQGQTTNLCQPLQVKIVDGTKNTRNYSANSLIRLKDDEFTRVKETTLAKYAAYLYTMSPFRAYEEKVGRDKARIIVKDFMERCLLTLQAKL